MARKGSETVWLIDKEKVDRLKPTSPTATEFELKNCDVLPRASNEGERGWVQVSGFTVVVYEDIDISPDAQMRVRDELYSVIGEPGVYRKRGKLKGILVTVERSA
jgi:hypothetical protein